MIVVVVMDVVSEPENWFTRFMQQIAIPEVAFWFDQLPVWLRPGSLHFINCICAMCRKTLVSKKSKNLRAGEAGRGSDCIKFCPEI